jgi:putative tricarboxylic transport membrane protein
MPISDRIAGTVLLAAALLWIGLVLWMIPTGTPDAAGARQFPLWFGIAFVVLSALLVMQSFLRRAAMPAHDGEDGRPQEVFSVVATIAAIAGYGFFMEKLGFLPATTLAVAAMLIVVLRVRSVAMIVSMSIGLAIGCYVLFGKLLGTYLPPGTWITLHF